MSRSNRSDAGSSRAGLTRSAGAAGFTLVEVLVVLAIVGLVFTTAAWAIKPIRDRGAVFRAVASFKALAAQAREQTLRSGEIVGLSIDLAHRHLVVAGTNRSERLDDDIAIAWVSADATSGPKPPGTGEGTILFLPDGTSSGGRLSVRRGDIEAAVRVSWSSGAAVDER